MATPVLEVTHLTKKYNDFVAVNDVSFSVGEGEILGLLGPNGAGKTTTIQVLLGLTTATNGTIRYFGKEFPKHREYILSRINFASAYSHMQGRISVLQDLRVYAGLYEVQNAEARIRELLAQLEIEDVAHTLFWKLSSGQKTRAVLAKALLNKPKLILMDEPTASLDPDIAEKVLRLILALQKKERVSILITSHDMKEVEELCDRVIFLHGGKIVAEDTPLGLTKRIGHARLTITFDGAQKTVTNYLKKQKYIHTMPRAQVVEVVVAEGDIPTVLFGLSNEGVWLTDIDIKKPDLEDVFLSIAKGKYAGL